MPNLKVLNLGMDVADGDLRLCMNVPYVTCKNRRHFNLRDAELPKRHCFVLVVFGVLCGDLFWFELLGFYYIFFVFCVVIKKKDIT